MLKTAVNAIAAALASDTETTMEFDLEEAGLFRPIEEFLSLLSAYVITDSGKGEALIYPVRTVNWRQTLHIHGADRNAFFLICGTAAKLNLSVVFESVAEEIKKEELEALTAATFSLVQFLKREKSICMSSAIGGDSFDFHADLPVPFVAGLILGSTLGKKMTVLQLGSYFRKVLIKETIHSLRAYGANLQLPMGSYVVVVSRRGTDFDCENGKRLHTLEEKEENHRRIIQIKRAREERMKERAQKRIEKLCAEEKKRRKEERQARKSE